MVTQLRTPPPHWAAVCDAFDRLVTLPPAERGARLRALALSEEIAAEVRAMLDADARGGVLDAPPFAVVPGETDATGAPNVPGYRIERLLGRGGTSDVYLAERVGTGFEQRVALKIVHAAALPSDDASAEPRVLAGLDHPGIAPLVDAGATADGRRYLALAYVEGEDLTTWCARRAATLDTRLDLFLQVCDATSYAHSRLVIHRDIKPANVRVDADGRARLLDFGIARLIDAATRDYRATRSIATPVYAAPEQLQGGDLTVATDVYALGALLFELLSGRPPWPVDRSPLPAIVHRIARPEPPAASAADAAPVDRAHVAGDLDAIVAKAMRVAPADRYASVEALARDVRRHRAHRPVAARAGARGYRFRRFLRRRRWPVAAASALVLALAGGTATTAWQARQAARERDAARIEAARLEAVNQAMILVFAGEREGGGTTIAARANQLARTLPTNGDYAAAIAAIADLHLMMEQPDAAKDLLLTALHRGMGDPGSPDRARLQLKLAAVLVRERRFAAARALLDGAERVWRTDPDRFRRERVETVGARAYMLRLQGNLAGAIALLQADMPAAERAYAGHGRDLASRYTNLTTRLREAGRLDEAAALLRRGEAQLAQLSDRGADPLLALRRTEALVEEQRGDLARATSLFARLVRERRAASGASPALAADLLHLARLTAKRGDPARAAALLAEAHPMFAEFLGHDVAATRMAQAMLAETLAATGRHTAAVALLQRARDPAEETPVVRGLRALAEAQIARSDGDMAAAARGFRTADAAFAAGGLSGGAYRSLVSQRAAAAAVTPASSRGESTPARAASGAAPSGH